ncbi:hypothetical protein BD310DRAFT_928507 [Dichomitus squalens]|uniref:Secreted protein n=1 Tax=Dichomitus squalens TaxID=114155 RepID=A0A4Q9PTN1_9APHY|nr:hypothetical protein BD310DRAFT_928507 [Dichomitus squalens]
MALTISAMTHVLGHLVLLRLRFAFVLLLFFPQISPTDHVTTQADRLDLKLRTSTSEPQDRQCRQVGVGGAGGGS